MDFLEFKKEVEDRDEKTLAKGTVGMMFYTPVIVEGTNKYEMSIEEMLTVSKPAIHLNIITDMYHTREFMQLELEFRSCYDEDMTTIHEFLNKYKDAVSEYFDDETKCPAMAIQIFPKKELLEEKGIHYLELMMPLTFSLTASKTKELPNIISVLFDLDNCYLHEDELVDLKEVNQSVADEKAEYEKMVEYEAEEVEKERKNQERMIKLQEQLTQIEQTEHVMQVGRQYGQNKDDSDN